MTPCVFTQAIRRRAVGLTWWCLGVAAATALIVGAYPTVRDNDSLNSTFAKLPASIQAALGLSPGTALTAPVGYLNSQFFTNVLPIILLVFALSVAAWTIAGDEAGGTLELLLANPISRFRVCVERVGALAVMVILLTAVGLAVLSLLAPIVQLTARLDAMHVLAAFIATAAFAIVSASLCFAAGAATGSRAVALGIASAFAVAGYILQGLAEQVTALRPLRDITPWHWLISADPLANGFSIEAVVVPLIVSLALFGAGGAAFARRDLR